MMATAGIRLARCGLLSAFAITLMPLSAGSARAELREDANRMPVYAAQRGAATALPYVPVRVGDERRLSLTDSGRRQLALRPAQVAEGGRLFAFATVPPELAEESFDAEFLVWRAGAWQRRGIVRKETGKLGHLTSTIVVQGQAPGPIPTAVFRRTAEHGKAQSVVSVPLKIPSNTKLEFGYSLDEWDWSDLSPVDITVTALVPEKKGSTATREVRVFRERLDPKGRAPVWVDARSDLSTIKGEDIRLVFRADPVYAADRLAPHVVWSSPHLVAGEPDDSMPSVVLVVLEGVRARSLGIYNAKLPVTPFMDRLFSEHGAVFEHAVTQAVETIPAQMSLLTGLNPCVHQVFSARQTLATELRTFIQVMSDGGYATAAFTDAAGFAAEIGFGRGFETFTQDGSLNAWNVEGSARATFQRAAQWAERHRGEPFVLVIHTQQAKPPYVPPRGYVDLFKDSGTSENGSPAEGEKVRYEREIRYLDDVVAEFVGKLDAVSPPDRTLLVVTSGHGEEFLEHGALEHGAHLYDETVRVPLLWRGASVREKKRYPGLVGLIDVAPTILELSGFEAPSGLQGVSFAKTLRKGSDLEVPPRFSEAHAARRKLMTGEDPGWRPPAFAINDSSHKLIAFVVEDRRVLEGYDLKADPAEKADLLQGGAAEPVWATGLRNALDAYTNQCKRDARPPLKTETLPVSTLFKLKAFGYL